MSKIENPENPVVKKASQELTTPQIRGFENVTNEDITFPRATLIQKMSPELDDGIPGIVPGSIIHNKTKEILSESFVPIVMFKNFAKFNARQKDDPNYDSNYEPGAVIWATNDPADPRVAETKWGVNGEKPTAIEFINFLSYFEGQEFPVIISFGKTNHKIGKDLIQTTRFCGGDMFSRKYKLNSKKVDGQSGTYYIYKIIPDGKTESEIFKLCEKWWVEYHSLVSKISATEEE